MENQKKSKIEKETLRMQINSSNKKQIKDDLGVEAVPEKEVEVIEAENSDMNRNVIKVNVPISNKFEILSTTSDMNVQPMTVNSDPSLKKLSTRSMQSDQAISLEPVSCSPPRRSPSFTPPGTPPTTLISKTLEEEIKAPIRGAWNGME